MPEFSVIIATHNRPQLLGRAVQSIQQQTYQCRQIIVVSDTNDLETCQVASSTMRTGDLFIQRLGIPGPAESRNLGMKLITGDYFIFLDDDDTFQPDFLESLVGHLATHSSDQIFYTNFEVVNEKVEGGKVCVTEVQRIDIGAHDPNGVYVKNFIPNNCLIFPKRLASEIVFDVHIAYEDWDFILSACARAPLKHLPIFGPMIHKITGDDWSPRGKTNDAKLLDSYIRTYGKHPPPNQFVASSRQELFSTIGLDIETLVRNKPLS